MMLEHFREPHLPDVPVLLLQAAIRSGGKAYDIPPGDWDLNLFSREKLPGLEIVRFEGVEHSDLVGYTEGFTTEIVREVSTAIQAWCHRKDSAYVTDLRDPSEEPTSSGSFEDLTASGIVFQLQKAPQDAQRRPPLYLIHCAEGVGQECASFPLHNFTPDIRLIIRHELATSRT